MNLNIETLNKLTEQHYKLLLEADPNEKLISKYLNRSFCFEATYNWSPVNKIDNLNRDFFVLCHD